jgi:preprotein translocase subunit SecD
MLYFARWKIIAIVAVCLAGVLFALPNLFTKEQLASWPSVLPKNQMTLGLDLQGGAHLLVEVDVASIVRERLDAVRDDTRRVLREARIGYTGLGVQDRAVQVRISDPTKVAEAVEKLSGLIQNLADPLSFSQLRDLGVTESGGLVRLALTDDGIAWKQRRAVEQSIEVIRRRIDLLGTTEPLIARQGANRILVQVPGFEDSSRLKTLISQTARLTFHLVEGTGPSVMDPSAAGTENEVLLSRDDPPVPVLVQRRAMLVGDELVDAQASFDQRSNEPVVSFRLSTSGGVKFAEITRTNVGRAFAIVLDRDVISYPVIREPITGGSGQISGGFSVEQANDLAILLRAGALPADLTVVEERTVGAGLGADSIAASEIATTVGIVLVIAFMVASYGILGVFACVGMIVNVIFTFAILSALGATLTLPGIAGIVLSVGMAVDANVLIFERIREEQKQGRSAITAIDTGFRKAMDTIIDANLTLLVASIALFFFGTGSIKGFAVTLAIGNITSFFTAITVTRLIVSTWVRYQRPTRVPL